MESVIICWTLLQASVLHGCYIQWQENTMNSLKCSILGLEFRGLLWYKVIKHCPRQGEVCIFFFFFFSGILVIAWAGLLLEGFSVYSRTQHQLIFLFVSPWATLSKADMYLLCDLQLRHISVAGNWLILSWNLTCGLF